MKKKISLLLAVFMIFTMLPMGIMAEDVLTEPTTNIVEGIISTIAGTIDLDFGDEEIDGTTLDGITITATSDGKVFKGVVAPSVDSTDRSIVHVKFGDLEDGVSYKLTVPTSVKNATGNTLATAKEFSFTAEKAYLTKVDFSEERYNNGISAEDASADNLFYLKGWNAAEDTAIATVETEQDTTNKYLQITAVGGTPYGLFVDASKSDGKIKDGNFNDISVVDDDKVYVIDADLGAEIINNDYSYIGAKFENGTSSGVDYWFKNGVLQGGKAYNPNDATLLHVAVAAAQPNSIKSALNGNAKQDVAATPLTKSGNWYKTRVVFRRDSQEALASDLYDYQGSQYKFIGTDDIAIPGTGESKSPVNKIAVMVGGAGTKGTFKYDYIYARPERLMSVISYTDYTEETKGLTLYMSKDIPASIATADVVVTNNSSPVAVKSVSVNQNERSITLGFGTGLTEGDYTIDISKLTDADGFKAYDGKTYSFNVSEEEASITMDKPTVKNSAGDTLENGVESSPAEISVIEGKISLAFASKIQNPELITFKKANGDPIKGRCILGINGNEISFTFGDLEDGVTYKITVPESVKDVYDRSLEEEFTFYVKAIDAYLTKVDFSEERYNDGISAEDASADNLFYLKGWNAAEDTTIATVETEQDTTNKYLQISTTDSNAYGLFVDASKSDGKIKDGNFNDTSVVNSDKVYVIDSDVATDLGSDRAYIGSKTITKITGLSGDIGRFNIGEQTISGESSLFYTAAAFFPSRPAEEIAYSGLVGNSKQDDAETPLTKSGNWYKTRIVLRRDTSNENKGKLATDLYNYMTDKYEYIGTDDSYLPTEIAVNQIGIISGYLSQSSILKYDYIYARPERLLNVIDMTDYVDSTKTVTLYMSKDTEEALAEEIIVKDSADNIIDLYGVAVDNEKRTISLTFTHGLPDGEYAIDISNLADTDGLKAYDGQTYSFTANGTQPYILKPVYKDGNGKTIVTEIKDAENEILINEATSVSVSAKIGNKPENIVIYLGVFDAGNNLVKVEKATIEEDSTITAIANGITAGSASSARLFIWEDMENIKPLFAPVCL